MGKGIASKLSRKGDARSAAFAMAEFIGRVDS